MIDDLGQSRLRAGPGDADRDPGSRRCGRMPVTWWPGGRQARSVHPRSWIAETPAASQGASSPTPQLPSVTSKTSCRPDLLGYAQGADVDLIKADARARAKHLATLSSERTDREGADRRDLTRASVASTRADVNLAKASDALIIGFNVRADPQARELSERTRSTFASTTSSTMSFDEMKAPMLGLLDADRSETLLQLCRRFATSSPSPRSAPSPAAWSPRHDQARRQGPPAARQVVSRGQAEFAQALQGRRPEVQGTASSAASPSGS